MIKGYRKKPVKIYAIEYTGNNWKECHDFTNGAAVRSAASNSLEIPTLEGIMLADFGDYIIQGIKGEFYPCKPDIFSLTYEEI